MIIMMCVYALTRYGTAFVCIELSIIIQKPHQEAHKGANKQAFEATDTPSK